MQGPKIIGNMCFYIRAQRDCITVTMDPPRFDYLSRFITKIIVFSIRTLHDYPVLLRCLDSKNDYSNVSITRVRFLLKVVQVIRPDFQNVVRTNILLLWYKIIQVPFCGSIVLLQSYRVLVFNKLKRLRVIARIMAINKSIKVLGGLFYLTVEWSG